MFKYSKLKEIVAKAFISYEKRNEKGVLESLKEFQNTWDSQDAKRHRINFGKAVGILSNKEHESAEIFNEEWFDFLNSGTYLSLSGLANYYDPEEILIHLSKINRLSDSMQVYEKEIDKIFAKGFT